MIQLLYLTDKDNPELIPEEQQELYKFKDFGIEPIVKVWDEVNWSDYKYILIRTVWDYSQKSKLFLEKLNFAQKNGSVVIHSSSIINWNIDKSYLLELQELNLDIVNTKVVNNLEMNHVSLALKEFSKLVIKPKVGAGGKDTFIVDSLTSLDKRLLGQDVLIQPFIPEIQTQGEFSYIFFDGEFSHSVLKKPMKGEFRVQDDHGGSVSKFNPSTQQIQSAREYISKLNFKTTYARVDVVESGGKMLLMELELIEPELFLRFSNNGMEKFIAAIKKQICT
jgi:glutathione synthase/RimK-type ligase-like ATP-grasp enzyme